jgi:hypothetical protein
VVLVGRRVDAVPDDLRVPLWLVPAYLATLLVYFLARAGRWWFLVRPLGAVAPATVLAIACAGFLWILLLPVAPRRIRAPAAARPRLHHPLQPGPRHRRPRARRRRPDRVRHVLRGDRRAPRAPAIASLYTACLGVAALFGAALLVLLALAVWPRAAGDLVRRSLGRLAPGVAERLAELARGIAEGLAALPSARPLILFLLVTLAYWAANALGMWMLARGCGVPSASPRPSPRSPS